MNSKKEIVNFLEDLLKGVKEKRKNYEEQVKSFRDHGKPVPEWLKESFNFTDGQVYEIDYILNTITKDRRKKRY